MNFRGVAIFIVNDKAYLPSFGVYSSGIVQQIDPVFICDLNISELTQAVTNISITELKPLADITAEEWKKQKKPLLEAAKIKSWKKLDAVCIPYGIDWTKNGIELSSSYLNRKNRMESDPSKNKIFPENTGLENILKVVLEDYQNRRQINI